MKIQQLLEADAYRFQPDWVNNEEPNIHMTARASRKSSSSPIEAYGLAYGMELNGVECPRRWKSTFATTNPRKSHFMNYVDKAGLRKLAIPNGAKVATVENDFNMHSNFSSSLINLNSSMHDIATSLQYKLNDDPNLTELKSVIHDIQEWRKAYLTLYKEDGSDAGYEWFKELLEDYDKVIQMDVVGRHLIPDEILGMGTAKAAIRDQIENVLDSHRVRVFNSIDEVPAGSFEVWFEGEYAAQALSPEEHSAFTKK